MSQWCNTSNIPESVSFVPSYNAAQQLNVHGLTVMCLYMGNWNAAANISGLVLLYSIK